jgi:hypothetical protein
MRDCAQQGYWTESTRTFRDNFIDIWTDEHKDISPLSHLTNAQDQVKKIVNLNGD